MFKKKYLSLCFSVIVGLAALTACQGESRKAPESKEQAAAPASSSNNITVKGSDTMVVLG